MKNKRLLVLILGIFVIQFGMPNFDASKVTTENDNQSEIEYAPQNPTRKQVRTAQPTDIVKFEDANLAEHISYELYVNQDEITVADMERLVNLNYSFMPFSDLTGLEYAINLEYIYLANGTVSDLSPLMNLTNLEQILIQGNEITDLTPLINLKKLYNLSINDNQLSNIEPLSELPNLKYVHMDKTQISDLTPLSNLTNLESLILEGGQISDLSPLSNLTTLTTLNIANNNIVDISSLSTLVNLDYLSIGGNPINDYSVLEYFPNIKQLNITAGNVTDISFLSNVISLESLYLNHNQISDLTPVKNLTNLKSLYVAANNLTDVSVLNELPKLNNLSIGVNQISDLSTLPKQTKAISAYGQKITLPPIKVNTDDEIIANLINLNGEIVPVSLGIPAPGTNVLNADKGINTTTPNRVNYSANISQEVEYVGNTWSVEETIDEGNELTAEQLIELFKMNDEEIPFTVDQSKVNYNTPGTYQVTFVSGSKTRKTNLIVTDVVPVITITNQVVHIQVGDTITDYLTTFGIAATEITDGDLTQSVIVDDSKVNYNQAGTYEVRFQITDEEGNSVEEKGDLVIGEDNATIPDPLPETIPDGTIPDPLPEETISETASEETVTETASEEAVTETNSEKAVTETNSEEAATETNSEDPIIENVNNESSNVKTETDVENTKTTDDGSDTTTKDSTKAMTAGENKVLASTGNETSILIVILAIIATGLVSQKRKIAK